MKALFPLAALGGLLMVAPPPAAAQAPAAGGNLARNGGFEETYDRDNLWDGVDKDGFLAVDRGYLQVLSEGGDIADAPVPPGVAIGDLNADGKPDLVVSDTAGYVRVFVNQGTAQDPKFAAGDLTLPFLALGEDQPPWMPPDLNEREREEWRGRWFTRRAGVRVGLADLFGGGRPDLVAGNYFGEIFAVRNTGSATQPAFAQPAPVSSALVPTRKNPAHRWGNVFSPLLRDWNGDALPDLLIGEGSYSANNIHLLLNQGAAGRPVFNEDRAYVLAFGDGREQLTPTVADWNGDGLNDLIIGDRKGNLGVYLAQGPWKPGDELKFSGFIGIGGDKVNAVSFDGGITSVAAGDLTGDGLFDLLIGKNNGRLVFGRNSGTKEEPKFTFDDFRGENRGPLVFKYPSQWDVETGLTRGTFYGYASAVGAQDEDGGAPAEGGRALRFGFVKPANVLFPRPQLQWNGIKDSDNKDFSLLPRKEFNQMRRDGFFRDAARSIMLAAPSNYFMLRQIGQMQLEIGATYRVSFKVRASQASKGLLILGYRGYAKLGEDRLVRGDRGAVQRIKNDVFEEKLMPQPFTMAANWAEVSGTFKVQFDDKRELNKEKTTSEAGLEISFQINPPDGFVMIDDVKVEKLP